MTIKRTQARRRSRNTGPRVPGVVLDALLERSGGACEMRIAAADCWGRATDPAHRIATGAGGRKGAARVEHDRLSNLIHACRPCHEWTHRNVASAEELGLMLREGDEPRAERVHLPAHGWVLLADDGTWEAA